MRMRVTRIGLAMMHNLGTCRGFLRGINQFAKTRPDWVLISIEPDRRSLRALAALKPKGIIAYLFRDDLVRAFEELGIPMVNVSGGSRNPVLPRVSTDDPACGRAAAMHFIERGLRKFAFVGRTDQYFSVARESGFREVLYARGYHVDSYYNAARYHVVRDNPNRALWLDARVRKWVLSLQRPVGLFAAADDWGVELTEVCRQVDLHVPEDVSIVGVCNDSLLCNLSRPPLSSVPVQSERIGFEAATLLDRLLHGKPAPDEALLLPPLPLVARRSSDILAIDDAEVAAAVHYIRDHGHCRLRVSDVVSEASVSRRLLERRFREALGRTILDEIRRTHVEHACKLLAESDLPLNVVAKRSGFLDASQFSIVFKQVMGQKPRAFRRAFRSPVHACDDVDE